MKSFDELLELSDDEKLQYLNEEVENLIQSTPPHNVLRLRALQSNLNSLRRKIKDPFVRAEVLYESMVDSLNKLNDSLRRL